MSWYKDQYIEEYDRKLTEAEDRLGRRLSQQEEDAISDEALTATSERMYDHADMLRKKAREEG